MSIWMHSEESSESKSFDFLEKISDSKTMEATLVEPTEVLEETSVDIPQRGQFVPCDRCRHRSYRFYILKDASLLAYCYHHSNEYHDKIMVLEPTFIDYADDLKENRTQGAD